MKITFIGSVLGYHQEGLAKAFYNLLGDDYHFISYGEICDYRKEAGFTDLAEKYPFVIKVNSPEKEKQANEILKSSDVIIAAAAPNHIIKDCVESGIDTYMFSERFFKKGAWRAFIPHTRKKVKARAAGYYQDNFKVLCASSYLPYDLSLCGWCGKAYQWGYFTDVKKYDIDELLKKKATGDEPIKILWAARFLKLKHPEKAIQLAKHLKKKKLPFKMEIIGYGELENSILNEIAKNNLQDVITFSGKKTVPEVHQAMENSDIFLMTSDYHEGWGVVINESLNHGCVVIADEAPGATNYLIENNVNGFTYRNDITKVYPIIEKLISDEKFRKQIQANAYEYMISNASPQIAAKRFVELCKTGEPFKNGVCSTAPIIKSKWF